MPRRRLPAGFTLVELLVVLAIIATLLTIAVPRYFHSLDTSKEATLRQDLAVMREALDRFYSDSGKYPETLQDLVTKKYLRSIPVDPISESSESWVVVAPDDADKGGVANVKSGAVGKGLDGTEYSSW